MPLNNLIKECNCAHCLRKSEQIRQAGLYWEKVVFAGKKAN